MTEHWLTTYTSRPDIYDAFSRCEDEHNKALRKLQQLFTFSGKSVLEIGCGSGRYTYHLAPISRAYFALDTSIPLLKLAKKRCHRIKNLQLLNSNATNIPLPTNTVDTIFASWALSAITPESTRAQSIKEMLRVLKTKGHIWIFENHWQDEFTRLRGLKPRFEKSEIYPLIKKYCFHLIASVDTNLTFPTLEEAKKVCGFIFGNKAKQYLTANPTHKIHHKIAILHRTKNQSFFQNLFQSTRGLFHFPTLNAVLHRLLSF